MFRRLLVCATVATCCTPTIRAQGWVEPPIDRRPLILRPGGIVRTSSAIRATIDGRVARFEVEEHFRNIGGVVAEGSYLYPLPGEAVFTDFSLFSGTKELKGEIMSAEQARGIYEEIVRRRRDPALLTLAGHGLVRAQVFPIEPGETRTVILRFTELLTRDGGAIRLRYASGARGGDSAVVSFQATATDPSLYGTPYSPTHALETAIDGNHLSIRVNSAMHGDLELFLPLRHGFVGTSVLTHGSGGGEGGYFMLLLAPPTRAEGRTIPRDLTLVVDVSGSMSGDKLDQAKAALLQALGTLRAEDRFRLIAFSSDVRPFRDGFSAGTRDNTAAARDFVNGLVAAGGTNIAGALEEAFRVAGDSEHLPLVMFMTDGIPSVGEQAPERLAALAASRAGRSRIFAVGVGHDVNTYLLDRLAVEGHGSAEYVAPGANVETAIGGVLQKITYPALVNLRIVHAPVTWEESSPTRLPDLFYGEELVVLGRYHGTGRGDVVIEGERDGRRETFTVAADFPPATSGNEFIPPLWAARRIGDLTRTVRLEGANAELVNQIRELGLRYGILTEYTSYLVQEPNALADRPPRTDDLMRAVAPAPAKQTGEIAFERAKASAKMAAATSLNAADQAIEARLRDFNTAGRTRAAAHRVAGRIFVLRDNTWTDIGQKEGLKIVDVAAFSPAYFSLVAALPEIAPALGLGESVLVAGRRVSVRIGTGGITTWPTAELQHFASEFRGR